MVFKSEETCASRIAKGETGAEPRNPAKHVFRRRPSKSSAVATAAAQAATVTKPASMTVIAKTWLARLRGDHPPSSKDKVTSVDIIPKNTTGVPLGTKGSRSKPAGTKSSQHPKQQQLQQAAPKDVLLAELVLEARAAVEQAVTATQPKAEQLAAAIHDGQQQPIDVQHKSELLERLCKEPKPGTEKVVLTELICQLEATRAGQAAKDSNIQSLTAELAAMRRALVDAEDERAKMEELYEQATAAASGMLMSQHQLTTDVDRLTAELSAAHTAQLAKDDYIQQLNTEVVAKQKHTQQVLVDCVRMEEKFIKAKVSNRQVSEVNRQLTQELAAAVADQNAKTAELQQLHAALQHMQQQLEEAASTSDTLQQLCHEAISSGVSASSAQQQLTSELSDLSADLLQARTDYDAHQARLEEVSAELSVVHEQLAAAQQTIRDLEHYHQQAVWPNNVNWQSCLLYGRERSGLLPEASIVTEPSCCGPTNSAHQECKTLEAALSPELSAASSSTGQCVMRSESSEALNSTQQDAVTESDPPSPLLSTKVSASKHFEDQQAMLGHKLSASLISQQAEIKSLSASSPELLAPSPEISTAFYSARGDFDGHRASLSAESSENLEPHMGPKARILHCTALLSQAQDPITERPARIPTTEVLCAKADAAILSATQIQDHLAADEVELQRQLLHAESSSAEQQQKLCCMNAELVSLQQELEEARLKIASLEQRCFEKASPRNPSAAGSSCHSSGCGRPSQADQLQALMTVLAVAVQQLEVAEAVSCSLQQQVDSVSVTHQQHLADKCLQNTAAITNSSSSGSASDAAEPTQQPAQLSTINADLYHQLAAAQESQASQKAALQAIMEELSTARNDLIAAEAAIQQLCEQIDDPSDVQQMLTEELEVARAAQAAQQVKLLELTAELKRVQQQLLEAEERSSQLEHFYEEVSNAGFVAVPKPPPQTQALLEELASLKQSKSEQVIKLQQLTSKLSAVQQQLVEAHARCLELEDDRKQAQLSEAAATKAQQQLQQLMHEHQESLNAAKSSMAAQRVKMQNLKGELEASKAIQELQITQMASMDNETTRLKKMLFERDPDAAYKAAVRHMDNLDPATKLAISDKLHYYSLYPRPDRVTDSPMEPKLAKTLLKCITYAPAVRSLLVLKQILHLEGDSHFGALLLKGAAKLLATKPKRFQLVHPKQQKPGPDEPWYNLAAGRSASNNGRACSSNGRAASSNGSSSQRDKRRGSDPGFCHIDVDKLLAAAVPYALEGERLHQQERTRSIIVATCLLQHDSSSSSSGSSSSSLHYSGDAADLMYWHEAVEAVAGTDASVRKDIIQMIQAVPGSPGLVAHLQHASGKAWMECLRGVYWLDADYVLARSLLHLEGLVVECPAAAAAAAAAAEGREASQSAESDLADAQADSSSSSIAPIREGIEVLKDLADRYFHHVSGQSSLTGASKSAGGDRMRSSNGLNASSSGGRVTGRPKRSGAGSVPGVRMSRHNSGSQM